MAGWLGGERGRLEDLVIEVINLLGAWTLVCTSDTECGFLKKASIASVPGHEAF